MLIVLYLAVCALSVVIDPTWLVFRWLISLFCFYWLFRVIFKSPRSVWFAMNVVIVCSAGFAVYFLRSHPRPVDPNDPAEVGVLQPTVMRRNLKRTSDAANFRVGKGEMTETEAKKRVTEQAEAILKNLKPEEIPDDELWEYGEVLWTAKEWDQAIPVLEKAVKLAKTEDRRINDSLRLAKCYAAVGRVDEAMSLARSTFDAKPEDTAPLLLAITKEIAPEARGKGKDKELAQLIEDAIPIYLQTVVDVNTDEGKNFIGARPFHIRDAWQLVADLRRGN